MRRWYSVAQNYLILNSILAAVSGIVVQSLYDHSDRVWLCVGTVALSLFVLDAEKTANAVFEDEPSEMVYSHNIYNFAVLLLLLTLAGWVAVRANSSAFSAAAFTFAVALWACGGWGHDFRYLLHKANRRDLVRQLRGDRVTQPTSPSPPTVAASTPTTTLAIAITAVALLFLASRR
jgi:hypothetical protein